MNKSAARFPAHVLSVLIPVLVMVLTSPKSEAIPAFSRQYHTSCQTCHIAFPKLNDFGKAFKDAGFKFPKDDETFLKVPAVMLGAPAQKDVFPRSVWPGEIPGLPPIGLRMNMFFQATGAKRNQFNVLSAPAAPQFIPATDFETGLFSIFTAGNFGGDIAFWVDDDISVSGQNASGGLGDAYMRFGNIGRFAKLPTDTLNLRVGQFELDLPFTQARTYNLSPYDIYSEANIGAVNAMGAQQNVANQFAFAGAAKGIELSGGHNYGGYHYSVAMFNQNTSGVSQASNSSRYLPSATGGSSGGIGFGSDSSTKDIYARLSYRFNLERDPASRSAIQAAGTTGPHDHTYLNVGSFYLRGNSRQALPGVTLAGGNTLLVAHEPFYRAGGDFSFNIRALNVLGLYMYGRDKNLLPVDSSGNPIPLPFGSTSPLPTSFISSFPAVFHGGFVEADYMILPWIFAIARWDGVHSSADRINALALSPGFPYFGATQSARNRFTPGVQFLIHPNVKASFEYQIRPRQSVTSAVDPVTGLQKLQNPFRVNTALFGLEFVY